jgi:hypothetical protein
VPGGITELNREVLGAVRFGDDSVVQIEGRGKVTFVRKTDETHSFTEVYYIPRLTTNIVSIEQLDKVGYKVDIDDGIMRIREPGRRLLTKVRHAAIRLYVLNIKIAPPVCLAARDDAEAWR